MIIIKDDVIPTDYQDFIEKFVQTEIPWFYLPDISGTGKAFKDPNWHASNGFFHLAAIDGVINSTFFKNDFNLESLIIDLEKSFEVSIKELLRVKLNLTGPITGYKPTNFCSPHVDWPDRKHHVMLYYINDSDGDTVFFKTPTDMYNEDLEITHRVTPKKGRCVLFDGSMYHTQSNPINTSARFNLNINIILND
jgi:hypothetical protein